jgi:hypothetical protein
MYDIRSNDLNSQDIVSLTAHNDSLYFCALSAPAQHSLYKSNGMQEGTSFIKNVDRIQYYMSYRDKLLYFDKETSWTEDGAELWITNGSVGGTSLIKILEPEVSYYIEARKYVSYNVVNDVLYFARNGYQHLWRTDGTECGTFQLDTKPEAYPVAAIGTNLIFGAFDSFYGREPHVMSTLAAPASPCGDPDFSAASVGLNLLENNSLVAYSPNPFTDGLVVRVNGREGDFVALQVNNFTGEVVETHPQLQVNSDHTMGASWPKGIYVLKVVVSGKTEMVRVVKK